MVFVMMSMSALTVSSISDMGMAQSLTVISNEFPIRSPSCMARLPV